MSFLCRLQYIFGEAPSTTRLRPPPPFGYPHLPGPVLHDYHHHHLHHQHHPYEHHHQLQHQPQERMLEPEPEPYVKMEQEWEQEWEWRGKEEYVQPGEAEAPERLEQYEGPQARQQAMQAEPMQAEPMQGRPLCVPGFACPPTPISIMFPEASAVFSTSSASRSCASVHASGSSSTVLHAFGVPSIGPRANRDRSITQVEQRRSPILVKVEEGEEESANENVMLEVGVSSCSVAVHVPRVAFLCLRPCFHRRSPRFARDPCHCRIASAMLLESLTALSTLRTCCLPFTLCSNAPEEDAGRRKRL